MTLTLFDIAHWFILISFYLIAPKLLTQDWKLHFKEGVYLLLSAISLTCFTVLLLSFSIELHLWNAIAITLVFLIYFVKIKSYSFRKAITLAFLALVLINLSNMLVIQLRFSIHPPEEISVNLLGIDAYTFLATLPFILLEGILVLAITLLFVRSFRKLRNVINQNKRVQTVLAWVSGFTLLFLQFSAIIMHYQSELAVFVFSWEFFFLVGFTATIFISFSFYVQAQKEKMNLRQKELEQQIQQEYMEHIEAQQTGMRKFKHDYKNILLSVGSLVNEEDWDGLKRYMPKVNAASSIITKDEFALESLSKIKIPEIKGLLAEKLMLAQNIDIGIHTTFEAHEEIEHIHIDSVALVRMLGIILDNAIEELTDLGAGKLLVACYNDGDGITFSVQNSCRPNKPPIRELKQLGYSSKGEGRGLGLNNLEELVAAHTGRLSLQTNISYGNFTQTLRIGGAQ